jgi:hypothetical protein
VYVNGAQYVLNRPKHGSWRGPLQAAAVILIVGCSRSPSQTDSPGDLQRAGASTSLAATSQPALSAERVQYMLLGVLNPLLHPHVQVLGDHFGGEGEEAFAVQRLELVGKRAALLVSRQDGDDPILLITDHDRLAGSKPFPMAGLAPTRGHLALAPAPKGGVALFGYAPSTHELEGRVFAEDGTTVDVDVQVAALEACDALSAVYGAGLGWIAACTGPSGTRAQRVGDDRRPAWSEHGAAVGEATAVGPATLVLDGPTTWVLVQRAKRADADHVLGFRYDSQGQPLWTAPADIGVPGGVAYRMVRLEAATTRSGSVRVELPGGLLGRRAKAAEVAPDGHVQIVGP